MSENTVKAFFGGFRVATSISAAQKEVRSKEDDSLYIQNSCDDLNIRSAENGRSLIKATLKRTLSDTGKEAIVYETNAVCDIDGEEYPVLAKILRTTSERTKAKMRLLCSNNFTKKGIACPIGWLSRTSNGNDCVGLLMPRVPDYVSLDNYILTGIKTKERLRIAEQLVSNFLYLSERNIQLVDFNKSNFLVTKEKNDVWFIDADSYQIENFPCTVVAPDRMYDHPWRILQGFSDYASELRKPYELAYGICVLLFEVLIAAQPYENFGDDLSCSENILAGRFQFSNGKGPNPLNIKLWQQCPTNLKWLFTNIFDAGGYFFYRKNNGFDMKKLKYYFYKK